MKPLLVLAGTEGHFLRTEDFVFAGLLATTVRRAGVEPMLAPYIEAAISANSWNCRVHRRYTYGFLCNAAETLGDGFAKESMSVMINHSAHNHEDVRLQGVIGRKNIPTAAAAVLESRSDGAAKAKQLLGTVMDHYIKAMDEDGDKRVVAQVCTNTLKSS